MIQLVLTAIMANGRSKILWEGPSRESSFHFLPSSLSFLPFSPIPSPPFSFRLHSFSLRLELEAAQILAGGLGVM